MKTSTETPPTVVSFSKRARLRRPSVPVFAESLVKRLLHWIKIR